MLLLSLLLAAVVAVAIQVVGALLIAALLVIGWFMVRGRVRHLAETHPAPDRRP